MAFTRRSLLLAAAASTATTAAGVIGVPPRAWAQTRTGYVMSYFTETPQMQGANYGLHLAVSRDGLNWTPLNQNQPVATPTAGTMGLRDPFLFRKQDGTFVVIATDLFGTDFGQTNQFLHVWDSVNLTSFTGYRRIRMHDIATTQPRRLAARPAGRAAGQPQLAYGTTASASTSTSTSGRANPATCSTVIAVGLGPHTSAAAW